MTVILPEGTGSKYTSKCEPWSSALGHVPGSDYFRQLKNPREINYQDYLKFCTAAEVCRLNAAVLYDLETKGSDYGVREFSQPSLHQGFTSAENELKRLLDGRDINDDGAANFQVPRLQNNRIDLEALSDADFRTMFRFTDKGDSESDPASSTSSTGSVWDISSIDNL
ncbi:hypothetical protein BCR41DRAFT_402006 [Lobosporangium transversale]|uniref:Uncharacterized protein n=1 Tax=Lobosporangium transversale TaxID=64571 RepID=A0A1Y2G6E2_9FUNG|nr:hypothetical protein BCR41DRAFT_402006 [Lobosporangium transversale]ORY97139.1 hypothetical protein BCR41DRAFT_402006 [Lobosporangium transversale]|eukprot:XP_021875672.1 hypothetical protein BCR41DRAFT_402006 [Lobosporangium transversale]